MTIRKFGDSGDGRILREGDEQEEGIAREASGSTVEDPVVPAWTPEDSAALREENQH